MKNHSWTGIIFSVAGLLAFTLAYFVIFKKKAPFPRTEGWQFVVIFALGLAMSIYSASRFLAYGASSYSSLMRTIFIVLGCAAFAILILTPICTKAGLKIPLLYGYRQGFITITAIIIAKWAMLRGFDVYKLIAK